MYIYFIIWVLLGFIITLLYLMHGSVTLCLWIYLFSVFFFTHSEVVTLPQLSHIFSIYWALSRWVGTPTVSVFSCSFWALCTAFNYILYLLWSLLYFMIISNSLVSFKLSSIAFVMVAHQFFLTQHGTTSTMISWASYINVNSFVIPVSSPGH